MDGYVTKGDFATIYGCGRSYVSQLVKDKRLVLSEDGKLVNVEASLKLLDVSSDPSKAGVRQRWQAYRDGTPFAGTATGADGGEGGEGPAVAPAQLPIEAAASEPPVAPAGRGGSQYHDARTLREQAQAELAQIELAKAQGRALDGESVLRAIADVITSARTEVMQFRDRLTPLVAPITDARKVHDTIEAECERLLQKLSARCAAAAKEGAQL